MKKLLNIRYGFPGILLMVGMLISACGANLPFNPAPTPTLSLPASDTAVTAEGRLVPRDSAILFFPVGGEVAEVLVAQGDIVTKGAVLARLGKRETLEATHSAALLAQLSAQQDLDKLNRKADLAKSQVQQALADANKAAIQAKKALDDQDTRDYQDQLDTKEEAVTSADTTLTDAQDNFDKYKDLDVNNQTRKDAKTRLDDAQRIYNNAVYERDLWKNKLEQAKTLLIGAQARQADALRDWDARQNGPDPDELKLAQARLDNSNAQLAAAQRALDNTELTAPFDGTVVELRDLGVGKWVGAAQPVITFADFSTWYVETKDLTEIEVVRVSVGGKVTVTPDALPDLTLNGSVEYINNAYKEKSGDILYTVRIQVEVPASQTGGIDDRLRWGMTVAVDF